MNLMLVDNQTLFREGLVALLQGLVDDLKVAEAGSLEEALRIADGGSRFDAVLIEPLSPGMNGYEGIKALRSYLPDTPIIVISANATAGQVRDAIEHGAMGYVTKETAAPVLVGALRLVLEGGVYVPPSVLDRDQAPGGPGRRALGIAAEPAFRNLTPRQRDVLELLARGQSNERIARALGIAQGTVGIHVTAILKALGVNNRTEAAITAARLLRQGGGALGIAAEPAFRNLTPRQRDVLELLARGQSNERIARALGIAEGTVRVHVTAILKAFGVSNRTEAAITAARLLRQGGALDGDAGGPD